jgi:hypothetical protein
MGSYLINPDKEVYPQGDKDQTENVKRRYRFIEQKKGGYKDGEIHEAPEGISEGKGIKNQGLLPYQGL